MAPNAEAGQRIDELIDIEICYVTPTLQVLLPVRVAADTSIMTAIRQSGVLPAHPEIDLSTLKVGVFGKVKALEDGLQAHDRIEIYRPLTVDPKLARERRVAKARKGGSTEGRKWANRIYR